MQNLSIRIITKSEQPQFTSLMYDAFKSDPLFIHAFGNPPESKPDATKFLKAMFKMNSLLGNHPQGLFNNNKLVGSILLERPMHNKFENFWRMTASLLTFIPTLFSMGSKTASFLNTYMAATRKIAPKQPHHYLTMIGVLSSEQGNGFGRKLIQHAFTSSAQFTASTGLALDTENQSNVAMYQKLGFELVQKINIGKVNAYCMFRNKEKPT